MRDGVMFSTDIYMPRSATGRLPTVLWKTPYSEHKLRGSTLRYAIESVCRGYIFILQSERGRYFSRGKWEILGRPQSAGYDTLSWIAAQPWSNGKVGTLGYSSSAEWQLALAAQNHPAQAAMVPMSAGAGIGKVGRFQEQGNWYTGGVPRSLFAPWLYGNDNPNRAQLPEGLDEAVRARIERYNDLDATKPKVEWTRQIRHLPFDRVLTDLGEPPATFEQFIDRTPADPARRKGGLYHDDMGWGVPALWFNSWYDVSIGPNLELYNRARSANTDKEASANQFVVVAPGAHCSYNKLGPDMIVGERNMGDTSFDVDGAVFAWFDRWLKGDTKAFPSTTPHVRYYAMGTNKWRSSSQWPPAGTQPLRFYLRSSGRQRGIEARQDVLVYTSDPLETPLEVTGFVDAVLKISSNAKDTDFAVKLVDVSPDGTAWIIGDTILRTRYRDGFDRPIPMRAGQVYTIHPTPIATSIQFGKGHRIRVEVTSSNFPKFVRNLNTGGPNESESQPVVADNEVYHSVNNFSYIELPVVR